MSAPASLRELYIDPSSAWAFIPPTSPQPVQASEPAPSGPSYQWSTRPSHNSIFDLSPSLDISEPSSSNAANLLKTLVASAVWQYTSTAIAMPWEVGKLLLQVQWVPRHVGEPEEPEYIEENDDVVGLTPVSCILPCARHPLTRQTDDQDYVVRRSVQEDSTRPEYIIPVGRADGVWGMMKRICIFRGEGWLALWKGKLLKTNQPHACVLADSMGLEGTLLGGDAIDVHGAVATLDCSLRGSQATP